VRKPNHDARNRYSVAMPLVRVELMGASPSVVLQFLAWLAEFRRWPRRVWWEWTGEGWREIM
jgi:hypothetical protein